MDGWGKMDDGENDWMDEQIDVRMDGWMSKVMNGLRKTDDDDGSEGEWVNRWMDEGKWMMRDKNLDG